MHNTKSISYTVRSVRTERNLCITVRSDGSVIVTKPARVPIAYIESFVQKKFDWILEKIQEFERKPKKLLAHYSTKEFRENKEKALVFVKERVSHFNQFYGYKVGRVSVRNQRSRWGSCSGRGNLSFNYKILFLPKELQDCIIVHELCHLKEMNHATRFWNLVAEQIPDHKEKQARLKLF